MDSNILAVQLKRIGDLILCAPAMQHLKSENPGCHLTLVADESSASLANLLPCVDRVLIYRRGRPNPALWSEIARSKYTACIDFSGTDRSALMTWLSRAGTRITSAKLGHRRWKRPAYTDFAGASVRDLHTVDYYLAFLEPLGPGSAPRPRHAAMRVPEATRREVDCILEAEHVASPYFVVHPGSARTEKFWEAGRWAQVIDHLYEHSPAACVLTGSDAPEEQRHVREILRRVAAPCVDLTAKLSLPHLAAIIESADLVLGVDTAAMHLASAFERPEVVLFGPTNPFHWRPLQLAAVVLLAGEETPLREFTPRHRAAPMSALTAETVIQAVDALYVLPRRA